MSLHTFEERRPPSLRSQGMIAEMMGSRIIVAGWEVA